MKRTSRISSTPIYCLLLASLVSLSAQMALAQTPSAETSLAPQKPAARKGSEADAASRIPDSPEEDLPVSLVTFSDPKAIPSSISSQGIFVPIVCAGDGTALMTQPEPPTFLREQIIAASLTQSDGAVTIDSASVPGFKFAHFLQSFANEAEIAVLGSGQKVDAGSTEGENHESSYFIFVFSRKGSFEKATPLELGFDPQRFGVLKSGNYLVTGFDDARKLPRIAIVDPGGDLLRFLDLGLDSREAVRKIDPRMRPEGAETTGQDFFDFTASQQIVPYEGNLLLVSPRTEFPVVEISDGGILRTTLIKRPKGALLNSLVPGDSHRWIAEMVRPTNDPSIVSAGELYEVDPDSGELLRRFEAKSGRLPLIACEVEHSFVSLRIDMPGSKAQLMMMTGSY